MKFKDFCSFQEGYVNPTQKRSEYFEGPYKWLRATDLNNGLVYETSRTLSEEGFKSAGKSSKMFKPDSIAISKSGTIGRLGILKDYMCGNRAVINIEVDKEIMDPMYVFYWLLNNQSSIQELAVGSVQKNLYVSAIENIEIDFVPLEAQKNISQLLQSIDRKIDNNTKIINNLERNSFILFKRWFIDFEFPNEEGQPYKSSGEKMVESELGMIPEGFKFKNLCDIGKITMGLSPKSESYNESFIGLPLLNGAADFKGSKLVPKKYTTDSKRNSSIGDLIFCIRATIGNISYSDKEYSLGRSVASITPRNEKYYELIYFHLEKQIEQLKSQAVGSVIIGLSKPDIETIPIVYPTARVLHEFYQLMNPIFGQVRALRMENEKLIELRDILLPKLLSGEIEVPIKEPESV